MAEEKEELSFGGERVRLDFNPGANQEVQEIKIAAANLIDQIERMKVREPRLAALAQTSIEEGAMWAVKLATTPTKVEAELPPAEEKTEE